MAKGPYRCTALLHPADAALLRSAHGSLRVQVALSDTLMPGVVSLPHGWGHDQPGTRMGVAAQRPGANLNPLMPVGERDPLSGNAVLNGVAVTLAPA